VHFWRTRAQPKRVAANLLIVVGAFVPSLSSGLTRFGITSAFFVGELVGLVCILAGFLLSGSTTPPPSAAPATKSGSGEPAGPGDEVRVGGCGPPPLPSSSSPGPLKGSEVRDD
jgi:hypothetical protein